MKRLKAYAVLACALVMIWSQVAQPYCAYALSAESGAISQSTSQASEERVSQDEISQGTQDDASDSQGQTEWYGDDANAARPDEDSDFISDDQGLVPMSRALMILMVRLRAMFPSRQIPLNPTP